MAEKRVFKREEFELQVDAALDYLERVLKDNSPLNEDDPDDRDSLMEAIFLGPLSANPDKHKRTFCIIGHLHTKGLLPKFDRYDEVGERYRNFCFNPGLLTSRRRVGRLPARY